MNCENSSHEPRGPRVSPSLRSGSANLALPITAGRTASIWDRVIEEEQGRIRAMCRMTYVVSRHSRSIVGELVGPTLFEILPPTER
ncbi:hypothetical protein [Rhizobium leguminosarum]|uniref:hypothetical protein n=1 Tax=Rhizobium leguminosarum TaxID=384 RepID=UPI00103EB451|nr:hypothetical protein [Rhizobium leguminosarum]TBY27421.1 hypothetical protein E0H55_27405 [Rhizobium leguminosarum bv. viciae]